MTERKSEPIISWTPVKLQRFKAQHKVACDNGQETFIFEGHEFLCAYAKYLIEYLEGVFK